MHTEGVSGFKPGSALLDPGRGQPMSLESLKWSIMSSDGLVHPWNVSNLSTQSLVRLPKYRSSHHHTIRLSTSMLIIQSLQWTTLDANIIPLIQDYPVHPWMHPVDMHPWSDSSPCHCPTSLCL